MVGTRSTDGSNGSAHRSTRNRPAGRSGRRAAAASLLLSVALVSGGAAALTPSATADVTAASAPGSGRAAKIPVVVEYDVAYMSDLAACPPEPRGCLLDLYKKDGGRANKPLVVIIHGGGWIREEAEGGSGTKSNKRIIAPAKDLARNGYVVLAIDYPGATDDVDGTPEEENAVNAAVNWAKANRDQFGINPNKVAFIGGSSAGQLSLLAAFNANKKSPGKITMVYSLSGPVDLWKDIAALQAGTADPEVDEGPPGYRNIELYLGCDWDGEPGAVREKCTEPQAKAVSPLFYPADSSCPLVRITRSDTEDIDEANALVNWLESKGCGSEAVPRAEARRAGPEHGFAQWDFIRLDVIADLDAQLK